jgi:hypothetical protein
MKDMHSVRGFALLAALLGSAALGLAIASRGAESAGPPSAASPPGSPTQPATAKKHAVPAELVQAEVRESLKEVFKKEIETSSPMRVLPWQPT